MYSKILVIFKIYLFILKTLKIHFVLLFLFSLLYSQPLFIESFDLNSKKIKLDGGAGWKELSIISSLRLKNIKEDYLLKKNGILASKDNFIISYTNYYVFDESYYFFIDAILTNQSLVQRKINPNIYLTNNSSGFGFQNSWVSLELGKGRQDWGAGNNINLALSNNSDPYDYFMLSSDYGSVRVNYFHGFLEKRSNRSNRYLTSRGVEWTNNKSLLFGFSETVIYSGQNRSLDLAYLNPIGSHLEVELNNRLNYPGTNYANAVWQFHLDWLIKKRMRFSFNYLFDEFVFDPDIEIGKENGKAFSLRLSKSIINNGSQILNIYFLHYLVGTPTFRHGNGENNFVQNKKPLGWKYGSDGNEISLGIEMLDFDRIIIKIELSKILYGTESIIYRPYDPYKDYLKGKFPSGEISEFLMISNLIQWRINSNYVIKISSNIKKHSKAKIYGELDFQLKFNIPDF